MRHGLKVAAMASRVIGNMEKTIIKALDGAPAAVEMPSIDRDRLPKKTTGRRIYCGTKNPNAKLV